MAIGGSGGAATNTDVVRNAIFVIAFTEEPACLTEGFVEVKVDHAGQLRGAKFNFAGGADVTVQNGGG